MTVLSTIEVHSPDNSGLYRDNRIVKLLKTPTNLSECHDIYAFVSVYSMAQIVEISWYFDMSISNFGSFTIQLYQYKLLLSVCNVICCIANNRQLKTWKYAGEVIPGAEN